MDYINLINLIAFIVFCMIYFGPKSNESINHNVPINKIIIKRNSNTFDDYKKKKFYENNYLYHIPNSRIVRDLQLDQ